MAVSITRASGMPMPPPRSRPPSFQSCTSWPASSGSLRLKNRAKIAGSGELPGRVSPSFMSTRIPQRTSMGFINCM